MAASTGPRAWPPPGTCARWRWTRPRQPTLASCMRASPASGVFQSTDGGLNWTSILNAATPAVAARPRRRRIRQSRRRARARRLAAQVPPASRCSTPRWSEPEARRTRPVVASFRARIRVIPGALRAATGLAGMIGSPQGGYSFHMAVDPHRPATGRATSSISAPISGEVHRCRRHLRGVERNSTPTRTAWAFSPQPGPFSVVYCGNDGGIFKCTGGTTFTSLNAGGTSDGAVLQPRRQAGRDGERDPWRSPGQRHRQHGGRTAPTWKMGAGGDGFAVAHDWQNATSVYGRCNATIVGSTDDGDSTRTSRLHGRLRKGGPTSPPSRPIQTRPAACMRAAN